MEVWWKGKCSAIADYEIWITKAGTHGGNMRCSNMSVFCFSSINSAVRCWTRFSRLSAYFSSFWIIVSIMSNFLHCDNQALPLLAIARSSIVTHAITGAWFNILVYLLAALREAQTCRYLVYSEANFEVFRPAGATRCTDGGEIWRGGGDRNFTPTGATTRV